MKWGGSAKIQSCLQLSQLKCSFGMQQQSRQPASARSGINNNDFSEKISTRNGDQNFSMNLLFNFQTKSTEFQNKCSVPLEPKLGLVYDVRLFQEILITMQQLRQSLSNQVSSLITVSKLQRRLQFIPRDLRLESKDKMAKLKGNKGCRGKRKLTYFIEGAQVKVCLKIMSRS